MKYSIIGLAIVLATSLLGCSDESSSVAGSSTASVATDVTKPAPIYKSVNIKGVVKYASEDLIVVAGQALYAFFRTPASDEGIYNLEILTNVRLATRGGDQLVQVNEASIHSVSLVDGMGPIEKKYSLKGLSATLHIEFTLQESTLGVNNMWITTDAADVDHN